jgi:hypothetical protein
MTEFFAPENAPFAVAICLIALIALVEIVGLLIGVSASGAIDSQIPDLHADADVDADLPHVHADVHAPEGFGPGPLSQVLAWLCVGRVPILVLLVAFLCAFGVTGLLVQAIARGLLGFPLPALVAVIPALVIAVPATRYIGLGLARIMPKEETEAVSRSDFVGKVAVVTRGTARRGLPAEAKLRDSYGQSHYLLVEPDEDGETFPERSEVLIVQQAGSVYRVIANRNAAMSDRAP